MKKIFLIVGILSGIFVWARAEKASQVYTGVIPSPGNSTNNSVYYSSTICGITPTPASTIITSNSGTLLYKISISSPGNAGSYFEVFDTTGSLAPNVAGSTSPTATTFARRVSQYVIGTPARDVIYNVALASGLAVNNNGVPPACIDIIYTTEGR